MDCELCGARATTKSEVEGVILWLCNKCSSSGKELRNIKLVSQKKKVMDIPELNYIIKEDFAMVLKNERQKRGLSQEQIGKLLGEKSSVIKRIEEGWEPSFDTVKKMERVFNIRLFEAVPETNIKVKDKKNLTIGDVIEMK